MSRRPAAVALALPLSLAVDVAMLALLLRGLHASTRVAVAVAFVITVIAWGLFSTALEAVMARQTGRDGGGRTPR